MSDGISDAAKGWDYYMWGKPKRSKQMKKTFVAFVLDESGSMGMGERKNDAISSFNEQLDAIRDSGDLGGETRVGVWTFGGGIRNIRPLVNYKNIEPITSENYDPKGMTPLYDAIGTAAAVLEKAMGSYVDEDVAALMIIITDGQENASTDFNSSVLTARIKELQDTNHWTFAFMGTTERQVLAARDLGMSLGSTRSVSVAGTGTPTFSSEPVSNYMAQRSRGETYSESYFLTDETIVTKVDSVLEKKKDEDDS